MHRLFLLTLSVALLLIGGAPARPAINYTGGASDFWFSTGTAIKAYSFRMKTTQTSSLVSPLTQADGLSSHNGWNLYFTGASSRLVLNGNSGSCCPMQAVGSIVVNDGNWHDVVINVDYASGGVSQLYVDGVLDGSSTASAAWGGNTTLQIARPADTFWTAYSGSIAEIAGFDAKLTADQVKALHAGFPAPKVGKLLFYSPMVRDRNELVRSLAGPSVTGTPTVVDHPRVVGGQ